MPKKEPISIEEIIFTREQY